MSALIYNFIHKSEKDWATGKAYFSPLPYTCSVADFDTSPHIKTYCYIVSTLSFCSEMPRTNSKKKFVDAHA